MQAASGPAAPQTSRNTSATADNCRARSEPDPPVSTGGFLGEVSERYRHAAGGASPSTKPRAEASGTAAPQTSRNTSATADNCRTRPEPDPPVSTGGFLGEVREQYRHAAGGASPSIKPRADSRLQTSLATRRASHHDRHQRRTQLPNSLQACPPGSPPRPKLPANWT